MPTKRSTTTIKVAAKTIKHISDKATPEESVDETLRRLFGLKHNGSKPAVPPPPTRTIKVSRLTMNHIIKQAKPEESRDYTICRLLKIEPSDGNVKGKP